MKKLILCVMTLALILSLTVIATADQAAVSYIAADGSTQQVTAYTEITAETTALTDGWYVVNGSIQVETRMTVSGDVHLVLTDDAILYAKQGITLTVGNSLSVYAQEAGTGQLISSASTLAGHAGIGGGNGGDGAGNGTPGADGGNGGRLAIYGGSVWGTGGRGAAGIGGGKGGNGSQGVTMSQPGPAGSGGKGGKGGDGCELIIHGRASVKATAGSGAAAIGGGQGGAGGTGGTNNYQFNMNTGRGFGGNGGNGGKGGNGGSLTMIDAPNDPITSSSSIAADIGPGQGGMRGNAGSGGEFGLTGATGAGGSDGKQFLLLLQNSAIPSNTAESKMIVTLHSDANGSLSAKISADGTVYFMATPKAGYHLSGYANSGTDSLTITQNEAAYAAGTYIITASFTQGGHSYDETGFCSGCSSYQIPELVNGVYQLANRANLMWFADHVNTGNVTANALLTVDIDMAGVTDYTPIGNVATFAYNTKYLPETGYAGTFDGGGHVIKNLTISGDAAFVTAGVFGTLCGTVRNLGVEGFSYEKTNDIDGRYGAVVGQIAPGGLVEDCYAVNCTVKVDSKISGGIAGCNYGGTVRTCFAYGCTIEGYISGTTRRYGHIVGDNRNDGSGDNRLTGTVTNCYTNSNYAVGAQSGNTSGVGSGHSEASFASGRIAYALTLQRETTVWGQLLGTDPLPGFSAHRVNIIEVYECDGVYTHEIIYTNGEGGQSTLPHAYTVETAEETYLKTAATCVTDAVYYKSCECGAFSETADTFTVEGLDPDNHVFDAKDACACGLVKISASSFPDSTFLTWVTANADTDADGFLTAAEKTAITEIDLANAQLTDLTGIGHFTALQVLDVSGNALTQLDLSACTALQALDASGNRLTQALLPAGYAAPGGGNSLGNQTGHTVTIIHKTMSYDMSALVADVSRVRILSGGTLNGSILTVSEGADTVVYTYDTGAAPALEVTLTVSNPHTHAYTQKQDESKQWQECGCGAVKDVTDITPSQSNEAPASESPEKEGLPTGGIVAIAVGGTLLLGGGGFALWWFVFRKKKPV